MKRDLIRPTANHISTLLIFARKILQPIAFPWLLAIAVTVGLAAIPPSAQAQTLTILESLGGLIGAQPRAGLTRDSAGNLYGTTTIGGVPVCDQNLGGGTVFKVDARGRTTLVHAFAKRIRTGCFPPQPLYATPQATSTVRISTSFSRSMRPEIWPCFIALLASETERIPPAVCSLMGRRQPVRRYHPRWQIRRGFSLPTGCKRQRDNTSLVLRWNRWIRWGVSGRGLGPRLRGQFLQHDSRWRP